MPNRALVPAEFDGHLERPLLSLTAEERLEWIWAGMELLFAGSQAREGLQAEEPGRSSG